MSILQTMARFRDLGIELWLEEDRVRFSAPHGALNPELRTELQRRKEEIRAFLEQATQEVRLAAPRIALHEQSRREQLFQVDGHRLSERVGAHIYANGHLTDCGGRRIAMQACVWCVKLERLGV